jgi:phage tail sheath protein FI
MPEYLAPGVYVEEVDTGSKPIEGVSTSTAGMIGVTERGPTNVPMLITSYGEFARWFGGKLHHLDFGDHCFLPHAAEGFFTNGGKRVYITRILDTQQAQYSRLTLFDRGTAASANTVLLRPAAENTGSSGNLPLALVLPDAGLTVGEHIRFGDGSRAEYRQMVTPPPSPPAAQAVDIPLHLPLSRSHADPAGPTITVEQFTRSTIGTGYALVVTPPATQTERGAQTIVLQGIQADLDNFVNTNMENRRLLEIGAANIGELRFVTNVVRLSPTQARVQLDSPLLLSYANGTVLAQLAPPLSVAVVTPPLPANIVSTTPAQARLDPSARAGDNVLFVLDRGTDFDTRTDLVVINRSDTATREVRRIGELRRVTLCTQLVDDYPMNTVIEGVQLVDDTQITMNTATAGDTNIVVNDSTQLSVGQHLVIGAGVRQEEVEIQAITVTGGTHTVTLTAGLNFLKNPTDPVTPLRGLTANANVGSTFLALHNRLGLQVGDVLRVGDLPNEEFVTITGFGAPAPTGVRPDAGTVLVAPALVYTHPLHTTRVVRQNRPALSGVHPSVLALEAHHATNALVVTDGGGGTGVYAANTFIRCTQPDGDVFYHRVQAISATALTPTLVALDQVLQHAHPVGSTVVERQELIDVQALDQGAWGNRLRISIEDETTCLASNTGFVSVTNTTQARLHSVTGIEPGTLLELFDRTTNVRRDNLLKVTQVNRATGEVRFAPTAGLSPGQMGAFMTLGVRSLEFKLTVYWLRQPDAAQPARNDTVIASEVCRNLSMDPRHSRYFQAVIGDINGPRRLSDRRPEGESWYIRVHDRAQDLTEPTRTQTLEGVRVGPEALIDILPNGRHRPALHPLANGTDSIGTLTDNSYIGQDDPDPENRTGLHSLRNIEEISIVACPGRTSVQMQNALINHCELMRYRFAVLDARRPPNDTLADVQNQRQQFDTKYAALYHPWLLIPDPYPVNLAQIQDYPIPPSGHTVGIYARTDIERGVHKAPANEVVRGITGLQRILNKEQQDILNPYPVNINVIRDFRDNNRGIRVYGGRCITSDSDWKYVNVRRLLIFIEASLDRGLQWVVFEPNAEPLWARVRRSITNFLTLVWRNGALEGTKPEEAFFVKCDRTTMTQTDIDSGRLICIVGVAPVKPAEFVIVRIGLWTARADN